MSGIYIAAMITAVFALIVYGALLMRLTERRDIRSIFLAMVLALPLQPLAYYWVRVPIIAMLTRVWPPQSETFGWIATLLAPITEEPAKLLPLLVPALWLRATRRTALPLGLALGLGFGIGEILFVAFQAAKNSEVAALPFYMFGGFLGERFMVCFMHGAMTVVAIWGLRSRFAWGLWAAMGLHFLLNFPIALAGRNIGGLGALVWSIILLLWILAYFLALMALVARLRFGEIAIGRLMLGDMICPNCAREYPRPLFGFNFIWWRYEQCPHCRRYHWCRMQGLRKDN